MCSMSAVATAMRLQTLYERISVPYCIIVCKDMDWGMCLLEELAIRDFPVPSVMGVETFDLEKHRLIALMEGIAPSFQEVLPLLPKGLTVPLVIHQGPSNIVS
jgi:hypothetical protein